jgi:uncharacterized membrane protein YphA (DoxX/SURF4 family)
MKVIVTTIRIIVGLLFIFSGLVKANDPMGLSYKMQEFFEVWGLHGFDSWTLLLSVLMNAFEIIAGFALLFGWRIKLFIWLLLLLIIAFTFLTGYTYITGKPKNCGCFGDCLPISSKTSFLKDVLLLLMIGFLLWKKDYIKPLFGEKVNTASMFLLTIFSFGLQWYALKYLPVVDCLPFKVGNNIKEKMKMPANAIPDSTVITFVYSKAGKEVEFTSDKFPDDFNKDTYTYIKRYDKLIRAGKNNEPPIKGFVLTDEAGADSTSIVLEAKYVVLLFVEKFSKAEKGWEAKFEEVYTGAKAKKIPCYIITADAANAKAAIAGKAFENVTILRCDYKTIETAARVVPTLCLLNNGTILSKYATPHMKKTISAINNLPAAAQ